MGQSISQQGNKEYKYHLKSRDPISISSRDITEGSKFVGTLSKEEVNAHIKRCIDQTSLKEGQIKFIQHLPIHIKHRWAQVHDEKVARIRNWSKGQSSSTHPQVVQKYLKTKLQALETSKQIVLKPALVQLQEYIDKNNCANAFIKIQGILKLLKILKRQDRKNREGLSNRFQNQIEIIKFLRLLQTKEDKIYYPSVSEIFNYLHYLLFNLNPIQVACTISVVETIISYIWNVENPIDILDQLQSYCHLRKDKSYTWILAPFIQILELTDNILVISHIIRLINELFVRLIDHQKRDWFRNQLQSNKYEKLLTDIKKKIKRKKYLLRSCTYDYVMKRLEQFKHKNVAMMFPDEEKQMNSDSNSVDDDNDDQEAEEIDHEFEIYLKENNEDLFKSYTDNVLAEIREFKRIETSILEERLQLIEVKQKTFLENLELMKENCNKIGEFDTLWRIVDILKDFNKEDWRFVWKKIKERSGQLDFIEVESEEMIMLKEQLMKKQETIDELKKMVSQHQTTTSINRKEEESDDNPEVNSKSNLFLPPTSLPPLLPPPPLLSTLNSTNNFDINRSVSFSVALPPPPPPPPLPMNSENRYRSITQEIVISTNPSANKLAPPPPPPLQLSVPSMYSSSISIPLASYLCLPLQKQKCSPNIPMKPCLVDVLGHQRLKDSVWGNVDDTKVKLDSNRLEQCFLKTEVPVFHCIIKPIQTNFQPQFLSMDRSKNIELILLKINKPVEFIIDLLFRTETKSSTSVLEHVKNIFPTNQEKAKAEKVVNETKLNKSQRFILDIIKNVPMYYERTISILYNQQKQYIEELQNLEEKQKKLIRAFTLLVNSSSIQKTLQVSLALSNYLNGQSFRGGAEGFKLSSIVKLDSIKSEIDKHTAATQMIQIVNKTYNPVIEKQFFEEISITMKSTVGQCKQQLLQIQSKLTIAKIAMESQLPNKKDRIEQNLKQMIETIKCSLSVLKNQQTTLEEAFKKCCKYYCIQNTNSQQVGTVLTEFCLFIAKTQSKLHSILEHEKIVEKHKPVPKMQVSKSFEVIQIDEQEMNEIEKIEETEKLEKTEDTKTQLQVKVEEVKQVEKEPQSIKRVSLPKTVNKIKSSGNMFLGEEGENRRKTNISNLLNRYKQNKSKR